VLTALLTAIVVVLGMRMMGTLLISALLIFPPLSAMRVMKNFKMVVILSAVISVICFTAGIILSYVLSTPVGATVVIVNLTVFFINLIISVLKK